MGVLRATAESNVFETSESTRVAGLGAGGLEGDGALGGADDLTGVAELAAGVGGLTGAGGLAGGVGGDVGLGTLGRTGPSKVGSSSAALGGADDLSGVGELAAGVGGLAGAGGLAGGVGGDVGLEALGRTGPSSVGSSSALEGFPGTSGSRGLPGLAIITSKKPSSAEVESLPFRNQPVSTTLSSRVTDPASTPPPCVVSETAHCFELRPKGALPPVHVSNRY